MKNICVNCGHRANQHIYDDGPCRPGWVCESNCELFVAPKLDTVTITISRKAAKKVADWPEDERFPFSSEFIRAARAALEGER